MSQENTGNPPEERKGEDVAIGRVLRAAVAEGLERQRGRSLSAFREAMRSPEFSMPSEAAKHEAGWGLKLWAGSASAIAACLAVVLTAQFVMRPATPVAPAGGSVATTPQTPVVDQFTYTRNLDGGTVVMQDQTPAHVVRQQTVKQTEWFDPNEKAKYSVTQPVETVEYQPLQPY